jgi:hypothetical protein
VLPVITGGLDEVTTVLLGFKTDPSLTFGLPIGVPAVLFVRDFAFPIGPLALFIVPVTGTLTSVVAERLPLVV